MSDGVWAAQLVDPDGHEETISSADPNTIVWWLERQAARLDPKPKGTFDPQLNGYVRCAVAGIGGCLVVGEHWHKFDDASRLWFPESPPESP